MEHNLANGKKTECVTLQQHIRTRLKIDAILTARRMHQFKALAGAHHTQLIHETNIKYPSRRRTELPLPTHTRITHRARGGGVACDSANGAAGERAVMASTAFAAVGLLLDGEAPHD